MGLQAIILCGGKGKRLRPLTNNIPKPLIEIKGKAILDYIIEHTYGYKIKDFVIATGYKSNQIDSHIMANHADKNMITSDSGTVDIIKRIKNAKKFINGDFLLLYGDTLSDINLKKMIEFHNSQPGKVTMTLWPFATQYGLVEVSSDGRVISFREKPILDKWINIGYFYFDNEILDYLNDFDTFEELLENLISDDNLNGYKHNGIHITVNSIQELDQAENDIEKLII